MCRTTTGHISHDIKIKEYKAMMIDCALPDECSVSCGGGTRQCQRTCQHGTFGDVGCPSEEEFKTEVCSEQPCRMYTISNCVVKLFIKL